MLRCSRPSELLVRAGSPSIWKASKVSRSKAVEIEREMGALAENNSAYDLIQERLGEVTEEAAEEAVEEPILHCSMPIRLCSTLPRLGLMEDASRTTHVTSSPSKTCQGYMPANPMRISLLLSRPFGRL